MTQPSNPSHTINLFGHRAVYDGEVYTVCAATEPEATHLWLSHPQHPEPIYVPRDQVAIGGASILHDFLDAAELLDVGDLDLISTAEYDRFFEHHVPDRLTEADVCVQVHLRDDAVTQRAVEDTEQKVTELIHSLGHIDTIRNRVIRDLIDRRTSQIIDQCVADIAQGLALGALDFDAPVIHTETGDAPFGELSAHDLLRAASHDGHILNQLTQDYTALAEGFISLIPTDTLIDPVGYSRVSPDADNWIQVGVELYIHHNLPLECADLTITPNRRGGIYGSHIDGSENFDLVLITPQRTHRVHINPEKNQET